MRWQTLTILLKYIIFDNRYTYLWWGVYGTKDTTTRDKISRVQKQLGYEDSKMIIFHNNQYIQNDVTELDMAGD